MKAELANVLSRMPSEAFAGDRVFFRHIQAQKDLVYAIFECQLTEEQQELVNPAGFSIGRAYLDPGSNFPCVICTTEGQPIGFIHFLRWLGQGSAVSCSFYIDSRHQGQGYGRDAARLAVKLLKTAFPGERIKLSTDAANEKAQALYLSLGFQKLDEMDGDDLVFGL